MYEHLCNTESGHRTHFPPWCWWCSGLKGRGAVWLVVPWCKAGSCTKYLLLLNAAPKVSTPTHMDILTQDSFMNRTCRFNTGSNDQYTKAWMTILIEPFGGKNLFTPENETLPKGAKCLYSGRELEIGIFGSAPDSATCFNHPPFISAARCLPA